MAPGTLRRRFALLLALLAVSSLFPWRLAVDLHEHLEGLGRRQEMVGTLRFRLLELSLLASTHRVVHPGTREQAAGLMSLQRHNFHQILDGDPAEGLPPCVEDAEICRRLAAHRDRWEEHIVPRLSQVLESGRVEPQRFLGMLLQELADMDRTVRLATETMERRVDAIVSRGVLALTANLVLLALVGFGVWEVFVRIRRVEEAGGAASEADLEELGVGADEVASLARTLHDSWASLRQRTEADRRRARDLDAQQRGFRKLATGLNDWIAGGGALDERLAAAAREAGFDRALLRLEENPEAPSGVMARQAADGVHFVAPLAWGDERLGLLELHRTGGEATPEARAAVDAFAGTLAIALVARELLGERDRRSRMAGLLSTLRDMDHGAEALGEHLRTLVEHDAGVLVVVDETGAVSEAWRLDAPPAGGPRQLCDLAMPPALTILTGPSAAACPVFEDGFESVLLAPLPVEHQPVGMLVLGRRGRTFNEHDVERVGALAPVIASALQRMRLTERLHLSEHLATVGGLSRMVAHEVRNPLNVLGLQLRVLERSLGRLDLPEADRVRVEQQAGILRAEIERLDAVVESYVSLATGRQAARFETTDLVALLQEAVAVHAPLAAQRGIDLQLHTAEGPVPAWVDRMRLLQAVQHLVLNALEAVEGRVEGRVEVRLVSSETGHAVHVRDNGPGISEVRRIFSPGYTTKPAAHGMGLPISLQVAQLHGGTLLTRHPPEGGAEFVLSLSASLPGSPGQPVLASR